MSITNYPVSILISISLVILAIKTIEAYDPNQYRIDLIVRESQLRSHAEWLKDARIRLNDPNFNGMTITVSDGNNYRQQQVDIMAEAIVKALREYDKSETDPVKIREALRKLPTEGDMIP